jgi:hypothetical protein
LDPGGVTTALGFTKKPLGTGMSRVLRNLRAGNALATTISPLSRTVNWNSTFPMMPAVASPLHWTDQIEVMYSSPEASETYVWPLELRGLECD